MKKRIFGTVKATFSNGGWYRNGPDKTIATKIWIQPQCNRSISIGNLADDENIWSNHLMVSASQARKLARILIAAADVFDLPEDEQMRAKFAGRSKIDC